MSEARSDFQKQLALQLRALDGYGAWKDIGDNELIGRAYVVPGEGDEVKPIPLTSEQLVRFQLQALAILFEKESGLIPSVVCEMQCDGSVKGIMISGRIVLLQKMFYNTGEFRFRDIEKLFSRAEKTGKKIVQNYESIPEEAREALAL